MGGLGFQAELGTSGESKVMLGLALGASIHSLRPGKRGESWVRFRFPSFLASPSLGTVRWPGSSDRLRAAGCVPRVRRLRWRGGRPPLGALVRLSARRWAPWARGSLALPSSRRCPWRASGWRLRWGRFARWAPPALLVVEARGPKVKEQFSQVDVRGGTVTVD